MNKLLAVCFMMFMCCILTAQNKLTGRITDGITGDAIPGAVIYIPDLKTGAIADKNGNYKLDNLPGATFIIQVSFLGYRSISEKVNLSLTRSVNFVLEQAITEMNEIVVTGTLRSTEITRSPVPMITLERRDLQQNLITNIIDAIARLPGVSAVTTGPNVSKPFIHGLGFNRVLTLFDGVRLEGQQWGDEHGVEMDENAVDHIEVIKGPASLTYGSDAMAGVVNMIPAPPVQNDTIKGHLESNYQSNNGLAAVSATLAGNSKGFVWGGIASFKEATDYKNKYDGRVYGTAFKESGFNSYIGVNKKWGYSHLKFSFFNDLQEIPDGSRDSLTRKFTKQVTETDTFRPIVSAQELNSYKINALHQKIQHFLLYSSNNFIIGKSKLGLVLGYQQSIRKEFSHPQAPEIPGLYLDLKTFTYDLKITVPESKGWEATAGINGMYQNNANRGTEFIIPDYFQFDMGPFILVTKSAGKLDLTAGLRYDTRFFRNPQMYTNYDPIKGFYRQTIAQDTSESNLTFNSYSHTFSGLSASFGATFNLTKQLLVKSNIARGFRAPNVSEISANGVHPGTLIYQIGNKAFKPELSLQNDIGISYRSDHISGDFDIFNNTVSNYIFNQKLLNQQGQDSVIIKGNQTFKYQQATARLYGWEASLDIHPYDWLHFQNSVSAVYAVNKGGSGIELSAGSRYLPFIPPLHTSSELRAGIKSPSKQIRSIFIKIGMDYYARQNRVYYAYNTETPTGEYVILNAGAGADLLNRNGKVVLSINVSADNVTNVAYQSHLSRLKYFEEYPDNPTGRKGIYNMGRNISFKFIAPLNF
jgi:iron complex outermembrane recepter protein